MRRLEHHKKDNDTRPHREQSQDNQRDPVSESHEEDPFRNTPKDVLSVQFHGLRLEK
jgi:hypothetical protein